MIKITQKIQEVTKQHFLQKPALAPKTQGHQERGYLSVTFLLGFSLVLLFSPFSASADTISDAEDKLHRAYSAFFERISTGKPPTSNDVQNLKENLIGPALRNLHNTRREELGKYTDDQEKKAVEYRKIKKKKLREKVATWKMTPEKISAGLKNRSLRPAGKGTSAKGVAGKTGAVSATPTGTGRPEFVLDGKDVPKEVEFKLIPKIKGWFDSLGSKPPEKSSEPVQLPKSEGETREIEFGK